MKTIRNIFIIMLLATIAVSCDKDENIPRDVKNTFKSMYSNTGYVEWEFKRGYYVAEFRQDNREKEAWFDSNHEWVLTETDIPVSDLPEAIKNSISQTQYSSWRIDDIDFIERNNKREYYIVELEYRDNDIDLFYYPDGTFIKEMQGEKTIFELMNI